MKAYRNASVSSLLFPFDVLVFVETCHVDNSAPPSSYGHCTPHQSCYKIAEIFNTFGIKLKPAGCANAQMRAILWNLLSNSQRCSDRDSLLDFCLKDHQLVVLLRIIKERKVD